MDFIKNNWGFLILVVILLGGVTTLGVLCYSSASKLVASRSEVKQKIDYIDSVYKKHLELSDDNIKIAQHNEEEILKGLKSLQEDLKTKYVLEVEVPATPIEGLRKLKEELEAIRQKLDDNNIEYSASCEYFTFESFARATNPPHPDDLKSIFKQLMIVKYVVDIAIKAEITAIEDLQRPMGLTVQDEGTYTFTPIDITIVASPQHAQNFINLMSKSDKLLFFLRNLELNAPDVPTSIGADIRDEAINATAGGGGMDGGGPAMGGRVGRTRQAPDAGMMGGEGGRRGRRRGADGPMGGEAAMMGGPAPAAMMGGPANGMMGNQQDMYQEPMKRQDLLAYEPKETTWKLRYDFIEFAQEENADGESNEDGDSSDNADEDNEEQAD